MVFNITKQGEKERERELPILSKSYEVLCDLAFIHFLPKHIFLWSVALITLFLFLNNNRTQSPLVLTKVFFLLRSSCTYFSHLLQVWVWMSFSSKNPIWLCSLTQPVSPTPNTSTLGSTVPFSLQHQPPSNQWCDCIFMMSLAHLSLH